MEEENSAISQETEEEKFAEFTDSLQNSLEELDEENLSATTNSGKAEEKMTSPEDDANMAQKRKIDAPMEDSRPDKIAKMEETEKKNQTTSQEMEEISEKAEDMAISSEEATPAAEKDKLAVENNFDDLIEEFVATAEPDNEEDDILRRRAEDFFKNTLGVPRVYKCFREALISGNSEVLRQEFKGLESDRPFAGILMIFCLHYHKKEKKKEVVLTILKEYLIEKGSIDVVGFVKKYELKENLIALDTLQRGLLLVMCIFVMAGKDNDPVNIVAEAFLDAYDAQLWGDEPFVTLYRFLRCPDKTLKVVGLTFVTAFATLCTDRDRPDMSVVLSRSGIVEVVKEMNEYRLAIHSCVNALEAMPQPSESSS